MEGLAACARVNRRPWKSSQQTQQGSGKHLGAVESALQQRGKVHVVLERCAGMQGRVWNMLLADSGCLLTQAAC